MLSLVDKPRQLSRTEEGIIHKMAYLIGSDESIRCVAEQRSSDERCRQIPTGKSLPETYHVRVRYSTDREGFMYMQSVWVAFEANHWSCFYDTDQGRQGSVKTCNGNFHFYFLSDADSVSNVLRHYEENKIIRRLAKKGPDIFLRKRVE